jgi:dihydroneopterin aldolase
MSLQHILAGQLAAPEADEAAAVPLPSGEGLTRVFVRDLVLEGAIGVHPHERARPQRIRFEVELAVRLAPGGPKADQLGEVVSYEDVVGRIRALLAEGHVNLCETLAERIARRELEDPRVAAARIRVEKLDVYPGAAVGVEILRRARPAAAGGPPLLRVLGAG